MKTLLEVPTALVYVKVYITNHTVLEGYVGNILPPFWALCVPLISISPLLVLSSQGKLIGVFV